MSGEEAAAVEVNLDQPMADILAELTKHPVKTRLSLTGTLVVARDIAHAKIKELLDGGGEMPQYLKDHPVYYAGPAKTPQGMASGSFGPTTAGRMDSYVDQFQAAGGSMVMLAKGNRSKQVTEACAKHGGFYLGSIGGPAARLAKDCIKKVEVLEYPELGMEAVWRIEVENFPPAFIIVDDKGNDFFATVSKPAVKEIPRAWLSRADSYAHPAVAVWAYVVFGPGGLPATGSGGARGGLPATASEARGGFPRQLRQLDPAVRWIRLPGDGSGQRAGVAAIAGDRSHPPRICRTIARWRPRAPPWGYAARDRRRQPGWARRPPLPASEEITRRWQRPPAIAAMGAGRPAGPLSRADCRG